ncbi:DUF2835 domain-containing protein [uncultured Desulfuromusa sp.]|uniref:DUF2835 domain-containing protein n=1 Tax=uncultured Desulfuromusa sp. TaxID=219183 RepID=UPI002AA7FC67|nr:DUF2835 domain-containing protein [uncultured Desulfuromusa sp.]
MMATTSRRQYYFRLQISQQQFLRYYQGSANTIQVMSECGKRLHFPAIRLRSFLTHTGINGRFLLTIDNNNRFIDLRRIS